MKQLLEAAASQLILLLFHCLYFVEQIFVGGLDQEVGDADFRQYFAQ